MNQSERLGETFRTLRAYGFEETAISGRSRSFEGPLKCKGGDIAVSLTISDWDFCRYPRIRVLEAPPDLPALLPHVEGDGALCYFSPGSVILDRYDPASAVAQCIEQATAVLSEIRTNPAYRTGDVQDEFLNHWLAVDDGIHLRVLLGTVAPDATKSTYYAFGTGPDKFLAVSDSKDEADKLAIVLAGKDARALATPIWIFHTDKPPAVPESMPKTIAEVFAWLKQWDDQVYKAFQRVLEKEPAYLKSETAHFAIRFRDTWLGFGFHLDNYSRLCALKKPYLFKQHLHNSGSKTPIFRLDLIEVGPAFVHSRNLMFPSLAGKRITVIGSGAIGSFLAESLARLGAGTDGGDLRLIDGDTFKPENLGRHVLGYGSLFKNKASELATDLKARFPLANVVPQEDDFTEQTSFGRAQLVIDATGEESVSEMLNAMRLAQGSKTPILHARIRGNGECVQTFWAHEGEHGCFRCLLSAEPGEQRKERFRVLKSQPIRRRRGCTGFTPYSVAAPMSAAALATEVIVDWLQGSPHPRFRTRAISNGDVFGVKDQTVKRNPKCPACSSSHDSSQPVRD